MSGIPTLPVGIGRMLKEEDVGQFIYLRSEIRFKVFLVKRFESICL